MCQKRFASAVQLAWSRTSHSPRHAQNVTPREMISAGDRDSERAEMAALALFTF